MRNPPQRRQPFHTQSPPTTSTVPRAICPNEIVGAVPVCPPERPRSGVSMPKTHASCTGNERRMRPCGATRVGTQAPPPTHLHHIFPRNPHKQKNHLHAIRPKETNRPCAIRPYPSPSNHTVCPTPSGLYFR